MLCPLSKKGSAGKVEAIHRAIEVINKVGNDQEMKKLLSGLWAFSDKVISCDEAEGLSRR